jgi:hypothetical protein
MATFADAAKTEILKMPDCEGLLENGRCRWLNVSACTGLGCRYYQHTGSLVKARQRLQSLDEETQERIAQKYYKGYRPWTETDTKIWR